MRFSQLGAAMMLVVFAANAQARDGQRNLLLDPSATTFINQSGSYVLVSSVAMEADEHAIVVSAPDVTIDLNGHTITGPSADQIVQTNKVAIRVVNDSPRTTIRNGHINGFGVGIDALDGSTVGDVTVNSCGFFGIRLGVGSTVENTRTANIGFMYGSEGDLDTQGLRAGIVVGWDSQVLDCTVTGAGPNSTQSGSSTRIAGIVAGQGSRVSGATVRGVYGLDKEVTGIYLAPSTFGFVAPDGGLFSMSVVENSNIQDITTEGAGAPATGILAGSETTVRDTRVGRIRNATGGDAHGVRILDPQSSSTPYGHAAAGTLDGVEIASVLGAREAYGVLAGDKLTARGVDIRRVIAGGDAPGTGAYGIKAGNDYDLSNVTVNEINNGGTGYGILARSFGRIQSCAMSRIGATELAVGVSIRASSHVSDSSMLTITSDNQAHGLQVLDGGSAGRALTIAAINSDSESSGVKVEPGKVFTLADSSISRVAARIGDAFGVSNSSDGGAFGGTLRLAGIQIDDLTGYSVVGVDAGSGSLEASGVSVGNFLNEASDPSPGVNLSVGFNCYYPSLLKQCSVDNIESSGWVEGIRASGGAISDCHISNLEGTQTTGIYTQRVLQDSSRTAISNCSVTNIVGSQGLSAYGISALDANVADCTIRSISGDDAAYGIYAKDDVSLVRTDVGKVSGNTSYGVAFFSLENSYMPLIDSCSIGAIYGSTAAFGLHVEAEGSVARNCTIHDINGNGNQVGVYISSSPFLGTETGGHVVEGNSISRVEIYRTDSPGTYEVPEARNATITNYRGAGILLVGRNFLVRNNTFASGPFASSESQSFRRGIAIALSEVQHAQIVGNHAVSPDYLLSIFDSEFVYITDNTTSFDLDILSGVNGLIERGPNNVNAGF